MRSLALALCCLATSVSAADHLVTPGESIQAAIDLAAGGDRVLVAPGTYVEQIDFRGKAIEVIGQAGPALTILDGGGAAPVVRFVSGEGTGSALRGFTVTNGVASFGPGGVACAAGATPTLEDCIVRDNVGKFGGGIGGSPVLRRCSILNNRASLTPGGGIYGAPALHYCIVAGNRATSADGGGLYLVGGSTTIADSVIVQNGAVFANSQGGGLYIDSTASVTIERTLVAGNYSTGGAFAGYGGGLVVEAAGSVLRSSVVTENQVSGSSTLGAGAYGPLAIENSIVRGNLGAPDLSAAGPVRYSDVGGGHAGVGNVDLDPRFVSVPAQDYHLLPTSPLIDMGDPALLDPDGTRSDIGAYPFQTLYTVSNTDPATWTDPSWPELSASLGGKQVLQVLGDPAAAGQSYLTLGSSSGTQPGFSLLGVLVPLVPDPYLIRTFVVPNAAPLSASLGTLDAAGRARTTFRLAPDPTGALAGTLLYHATLMDTPGAGFRLLVTNAEPLALTR